MNIGTNLGDKLKEAMGEVEEKGPKRNPRSGIDLPNLPLRMQPVLETLHNKNRESVLAYGGAQKSLETGHKNDVEVTNASASTNQNNGENQNMNQNIGTETNGNINGNQAPNQGMPGFDERSLRAAETGVRSLEKVANEGITIKPLFKRRDASGATCIGAAVGIVVGGAAAAAVMALVPATSTNTEVMQAGATGAYFGGFIGGLVGYVAGSREPGEKIEDKKS